MTHKKTTIAAGKRPSKPTEGVVVSVLAQRVQSKSQTVTQKSGQVISRTVATHRDALKRLADR